VSPRRQEVLERFLASVDALATDPAQLLEAVAFGLDRVLDEILRSACREADVDVEEFSEWVARDQTVRSELQERVGRIFQAEAIERARARAHIREIDRHLQVLRFTLSGAQPDGWVWQTLDREERARLRAVHASGDQQDPPLLARVTEALARLRRDPDAFGRCDACQQAIPGDRLRLVPWAERCTPCQLAKEDGGSREVDRRVAVMKFFEQGLPVPREERPLGDEV
jgi:RNA polymerase-binding transcription factor DksA